MFLLVSLLLFGIACAIWVAAGRLRSHVDAHVASLTDLDYALSTNEIEIDRVLQRMADHFRQATLGEIMPAMRLRDIVVSCPPLREVLLARRGGRPRMMWEQTLAEFAEYAGQDLDALLAELRQRQAETRQT